MSPTKREQQKNDRRIEILNCSLDLLVSRGYAAMKIRDIADKLNISVGLFFNYFESKEKVYEELINVGMSGPQNIVELYREDMEPIDYFEMVTMQIFEAIKRDTFTAKMFMLMIQTINSETTPVSVRRLLANFDIYTPLIPAIEKGQEMNQIKQGDATSLLVAFWGSIQGIAQTYVLNPSVMLPNPQWIVDIIRV